MTTAAGGSAEAVFTGGNVSRVAEIAASYERGGAGAEKYRQYLEQNAHQFGLRPEDVQALKSPMLVREVDTTGHDPKMLVRQLNENFTQSMDPRTMQVAMGRKIDERALSALAGGMEDDETLNDFLGSSRADAFVSSLQRAGVIDRRNANQYMSGKRLNEDGKTLVERILVGKVLDDADLLSDTKPSMINAFARAVPYMVQAEAFGDGYSIRNDLKTALHAYNEMKRNDLLPSPKDLKRGAAHVGKVTESAVGMIRDLFEGDHPVTQSPRARKLLDVLVQKTGPLQVANIFREYARMAKFNPQNQDNLWGDTKTPDDVFRLSIEAATDAEAKSEADAAREAQHPVVPAGGLEGLLGQAPNSGATENDKQRGMFASLTARRALGRGLR